MKTRFSLLGASRTRVRAFLIAVLCAIGSLAPECKAVSIFTVTINTTFWVGQNGTLAFDLIGGDALVANNTVTIGGLATNGTLGSAAGFAITDVGFFNEELRDITFGTFLNFTLQLTENHAAPGFDQFSFFLLDAVTLLPLVGTTDPTGADALFAIDITGRAGGNASVFESTVSGPSWQVTLQPTSNVPDGGHTVFLATLALCCGGLFRTLGRRGGRG